MKVKELIEKLQKADPEARVCIEYNEDPEAQMVVQYNLDKSGNTCVYVCDNTKYLDKVMPKPNKRTEFW